MNNMGLNYSGLILSFFGINTVAPHDPQLVESVDVKLPVDKEEHTECRGLTIG